MLQLRRDVPTYFILTTPLHLVHYTTVGFPSQIIFSWIMLVTTDRRHTCTFRDAPVAPHEVSQARCRLHRSEGRFLNKFDGLNFLSRLIVFYLFPWLSFFQFLNFYSDWKYLYYLVLLFINLGQVNDKSLYFRCFSIFPWILINLGAMT